MTQPSTKEHLPKRSLHQDQPFTNALSNAPGQVMTLSEAWRDCAQQVKLAVRSEQKARLDYLKNTEYGKEFMMRMTEVATVVVDHDSAGGKRGGNAAGMLGVQEHSTSADAPAAQVRSKQAVSIIPGMADIEIADATEPKRRASRRRQSGRRQSGRRQSVRSKHNAEPSSGVDEKDAAQALQEERSESGADASGCGEAADDRRSSKAASQKRRSTVKGAQRGKSKSGKDTKVKPDEQTSGDVAALALGGNFGIF